MDGDETSADATENATEDATEDAAENAASRATTITPLATPLYLAPAELEYELHAELGRDAALLIADGRLFAAPGPVRDVAWALTTWLDPVRIRFTSNDEAVRALRQLGDNLAHLSMAASRQATAIEKRIPSTQSTLLAFPPKTPSRPYGAWTLAGPDEIIASPRCTSPFPNGEPAFVEDHRGPPSRAYLKLWESLTLLGRWPVYGDRCVDLGSSPGGWTWAAQALDAWVLSVDKAPLDPRVSRLPRVECRQTSAFTIDPASVGRIDWVLCDMICYPDRLFVILEQWLATHPAAGYVITIKLQGATDMAPLRAFVEKHGGRLRHLHNNKHELTWLRGPTATRRPRRVRPRARP